ncbi:MAG: DinB family protein [Bacillota bacterium]|nr:DinB family protein [Bacillota bacterium]
MSRQTVSALELHLGMSLEMLRKVVDCCPDDSVWLGPMVDFPLWQQVYHAVYYADHWLREDYSSRSWRTMTWRKEVTPQLGKPSPAHLTRQESLDFLAAVRGKVKRYFDALEDSRLWQPISSRTEITYMDAIIGQLRHVMYHVGNCNRMLKESGAPTAGWLAPFE